MKTNYHTNIAIYKIDSIFNWLQPFIGVWVLIWTRYMDFTQIGLIYSISLLVGTLLELPSGALADMIGRKKTIILGRMFSIASYAIYFFGRNFWAFLLAQVLTQINWAFESGAQSALLYDSLKENKQEKKLYKKIETDTFFLCTVFMGTINSFSGWFYEIHPHLPYLLGLIFAIIGFLFSLFYQEPHIDSEKFSFITYLKQNIEGTKHIFRNPTIKAISFYSFIISFVTYTGLWYLYEPRLTVGNFNPKTLSLLVGGTYFIRAIGTKLIPLMDKKLKTKQIPTFLIIFQALGSFLSFLPGKAFAIGSVFSRKFLDGFRMPILANLQNQHIDSKYRATSLSAISLGINLLVAAAGPFIGYSIEHFGAGITLGAFGFFGLIFGLPSAKQLSNIES